MPHNREERQREIENRYGNRVCFAPGQYNALQSIPIAVDVYLTGGSVTKEWAEEEFVKTGADVATFLASQRFNPIKEELVGDVMTFKIWEIDPRISYNVFVPFIGIRAKS